jgi:hypothetical protein
VIAEAYENSHRPYNNILYHLGLSVGDLDKVLPKQKVGALSIFD